MAQDPPPAPRPDYAPAERVPPDPISVLDEAKVALDKEAAAYASGEAKPRIPVHADRRVTNPNELVYRRQVNGLFTYGWFPGAYGFSQNFDARANIGYGTKVLKAVEIGDRPYRVFYPSPARASHSEVLEQFFKANLTKTEVPFVDDAEIIPSLTARVTSSHLAAKNSPHDQVLTDHERNERAQATEVYNYIKNNEDTYIQKIATTRNPTEKDDLAFKMMQRLVSRYENDSITIERNGKTIPNPATMLAAMATGNRTRVPYQDPENPNAIVTTYDGSYASMSNYVDAVKRNSRYGENGNRSAAFAEAKRKGYTPGEHISPASVLTVEDEGKARVAKLEAALEVYKLQVEQIAVASVGQPRNGVMPPSVIEASIAALQRDAKNGTLGDEPKIYRGNVRDGMPQPLSKLLEESKGNQYIGRGPAGGAEATSVDNVIEAMEGGQDKRLDVLGNHPEMVKNEAIPLNRIDLSDGLVDDLITSVKYLADAKAALKPEPPKSAPIGPKRGPSSGR